MNELEASILAGQMLVSGRISVADVQALVANPGLTHYAPCEETELLPGLPGTVLIAPDGTPCVLDAFRSTQHLSIGEEFYAEGKIEVVVASPVPVYRVENASGIWAVIVFDGHPTQIKAKDVRAAGDDHYVITRDDDGDTLWALWNDKLSKALQAPTIIRVHNKVLMEYGRDSKRWIEQYACSERRWEVRGQLISAAITPMGMLVAILKTDDGRVIVRGEEGVVEARHKSPKIRSEVHGEDAVMLDAIGDTLFSARSSVACLVSVDGRQDALVIDRESAKLCHEEVFSLSCYPFLSHYSKLDERVRVTYAGRADVLQCSQGRWFFRRGDFLVFLGEEGKSLLVAWGENLEHRVTLRNRGKVDPQHFAFIDRKGFHKIVFAQRVGNEHILTDGHVQYGEPFTEMLRLQSTADSGSVLAWVIRGHNVVRLEATVIAN